MDPISSFILFFIIFLFTMAAAGAYETITDSIGSFVLLLVFGLVLALSNGLIFCNFDWVSNAINSVGWPNSGYLWATLAIWALIHVFFVIGGFAMLSEEYSETPLIASQQNKSYYTQSSSPSSQIVQELIQAKSEDNEFA